MIIAGKLYGVIPSKYSLITVRFPMYTRCVISIYYRNRTNLISQHFKSRNTRPACSTFPFAFPEPRIVMKHSHLPQCASSRTSVAAYSRYRFDRDQRQLKTSDFGCHSRRVTIRQLGSKSAALIRSLSPKKVLFTRG